EVGEQLKFPASRIEHDFAWAPDHPVVDAYRNYRKMPYDRQTWDLTAVLYGVRADGGYFTLSPPGTVTVNDAGVTSFHADAAGRHRYLVLEPVQKARTLETMVTLASQPRR